MMFESYLSSAIPSSTDADLAGPESATTLGNWLDGTPYPMCNPKDADLAAIEKYYEIESFPTIIVICPDKTIREIQPIPADDIYSIVLTHQCPSKILVDLRLETLEGKSFTTDGNFTFNVLLKNQGFYDINQATITAKDGKDNTLAQMPLNQSLKPYEFSDPLIFNVNNVPADIDSMNFDFLTESDNLPDNNKKAFKVNNYLPEKAISLPYFENFDDNAGELPKNIGMDCYLTTGLYKLYNGFNDLEKLIGANDQITNAVLIPFIDIVTFLNSQTGIMIQGNFNCSAASKIQMEFDYSYAQREESSNDIIEVVASTNSGCILGKCVEEARKRFENIRAYSYSFLPRIFFTMEACYSGFNFDCRLAECSGWISFRAWLR